MADKKADISVPVEWLHCRGSGLVDISDMKSLAGGSSSLLSCIGRAG